MVAVAARNFVIQCTIVWCTYAVSPLAKLDLTYVMHGESALRGTYFSFKSYSVTRVLTKLLYTEIFRHMQRFCNRDRLIW
jgi:hypothetical protein